MNVKHEIYELAAENETRSLQMADSIYIFRNCLLNVRKAKFSAWLFLGAMGWGKTILAMTKVTFLPRLKEIACGALVYCDYAMAFRTDSEPKGQSAVKSATRKQLATTTQATCNSNTIDNSNLNASLQKSGQEGGVSQKRPQQNEKPDSEILRERKSANSKSLFTFAFISILSGRYNFPNCWVTLSR